MKALPARFEQRHYTAKCDPTVTFSVEPLNSQLTQLIRSLNLEVVYDDVVKCPECGREGTASGRYNGGGASYDAVGFTLKSITGLDGFDYQTEEVKSGRNKYQRVTDACLNTIPTVLYDEIHVTLNAANAPTKEETDDMGFTQPSSTQADSTNAPDEKKPVSADGTPSKSTESPSPDVHGSE